MESSFEIITSDYMGQPVAGRYMDEQIEEVKELYPYNHILWLWNFFSA